MFVFNLLGPQVHHLLYYPLRKPINDDAKVLQPKDEFFLTVVKPRRNMCNKELGFRFGVLLHSFFPSCLQLCSSARAM